MMYAIMYMTEKLFNRLQQNTKTFEPQTLEVLQKTPKTSKKSKKDLAADYVEDVAVKEEADSESKAMSCDEVFETYFKICILVCKNEQGFFNREEKIALLMLAFQNIKYLGRVISMKAISRLTEEPESTELILSTALQLNDMELLTLNQLDNVYGRIKAQRATFSNLKKPNKEQLVELIQYRKDIKELHKFHSAQADILLKLLTGLIETELSPGTTSTTAGLFAPLFEACRKDKAFWLQLLGYAIDEYITQVEECDLLFKILQEKPELNQGDEIVEDLPEKRSSAGSLRVL